MGKRIVLGVVVVFVVWSILDYVLHGLLLGPTYEATAALWRPMDQMNMPLMYLVTLIFTCCFVLIYGLLIGQKSVASGARFGLLFGIAAGVSMGFGTYTTMPIPLVLALVWFCGTLIEAVAAGVLVGAIVKS